MIDIVHDEPHVEATKNRDSRITEVYTTKIPKLACIKRWFAREIVEVDFGEEFEVEDYNIEKEVGIRKRKMCSYSGHFIFAPDVEVNVYEAEHFTRVYLKYEPTVEDQVLEVREKLKETVSGPGESGLVRRIIGVGKK